MSSVTRDLTRRGLITPPRFLPDNTHYETMMGSVAYGVSDVGSDIDVYGFCIPPKTLVFPHLGGEIPGFGRQLKRFEQYQQHRVVVSDTGKEYDVTIYGIVKFFQLCMENNPNMIDSLFTPQRCVVHCTSIGSMVREKRRLFLHKGSWHKFKGYAYSQLNKMSGHQRSGKRKESFERHGFDVKFAYHVVRLLYEAQMILEEGDVDLERNREHLKAIRRGEISESEIREWATAKEKDLERVYHASKLRHSPDEGAIKSLLLACLEEHYGDLREAVFTEDHYTNALRQIRDVISRIERNL